MGKTTFIILLIIFNLFFIAFVSAIIVYIRQYQLKKKEHNATIAVQEEAHQKELLSARIEIQQQTMQHIGREIHDNIGQKLTLASLYTQQLAYENKAPHIKESIENISSIINQSLSELRELSKSLTNDTIENTSIYELLQAECDKVNTLKVCRITFGSNDKTIHLPHQTKTVLLRILQEFIQNSIKHSDCKQVRIVLFKKDNAIEFSLEDDGKGFDAGIKTNGIGLKNIKKRIAIIHGKYSLQSDPAGTKLNIEIALT
ncbi:histidine kinase [Flavobacterium sp. DGU11]|uniref:histidine kinase n=1 Tax=Flavobacterium arundinis TaxID=3139143 RepID=A0ABU9I1S0_9FLAO